MYHFINLFTQSEGTNFSLTSSEIDQRFSNTKMIIFEKHKSFSWHIVGVEM